MPDHAVRFGSGTLPTAAPTFAALDLGTNNCRLLIAAAPTRHGFRVVDSFSRIVRLGEGLHSSGRLSDAAMDRTLGALRACAIRIGRRRLRGLRAVATEACRRAENGRAFLDRVWTETGLSIDVISTREEAELALESCAPLLGADLPERPTDRGDVDGTGVRSRPVGQRGDLRLPSSAPRLPAGAGLTHSRALLFDIGGGSTETAWIRVGRGNAGAQADDARTDHARTVGRDAVPALAGYQSLPLGVLTLSELFGDAAFTAAGYEAMVEHVTERLHAFEAVHCIRREARRGMVRLLGTSGTVTTLASVALGLRRYQRVLVDGTVLSAHAARETIALLRRLGPDGLRRHLCVGPERTASVLPGCAIFEAIQRSWPTDGGVVADRGLRDGMLLRMMRDRSPAVDRLPVPVLVPPALVSPA